MKERPIIFSAPMVRAILAGAKTQTRRVVKPQPDVDEMGNACWNGWNYGQTTDGVPVFKTLASPIPSSRTKRVLCPYGRPGDRLWVRETWYCDDYRVQRGPYLKPDDLDVAEARDDGTLIYRASSGDRPYEAEQPVFHPSIHMPRWASRVTLEITSVLVERLQDISDADARAEGIYTRISHKEGIAGRPAATRLDGSQVLVMPGTARMDYRSLWKSLHGTDSWDANPWVWVVEFKRINQAEGA